LQIASRQSQGPWDIGKDFENAAVIGLISPADEIGHPARGRISLTVNGETRQDSDLGYMVWSVAEIIAHLSRFYRLEPGDLIYTGTPDGVGPVQAGDTLDGEIAGVGGVQLKVS
jgi:fumarylpyruvate hydrolase